MATVVEGLVVYPERMREHAMAHGGIAFSQSALLALVDSGLARDDAYRIVQRAAASAWDEGASFRDELAADPQVAGRIDLEEVFDLPRFLRNLGGVFDRLEKLPVSEV
jgi:adenylosuccinate lyase